jgi:choice-of-anchor B domain-containing protein
LTFFFYQTELTCLSRGPDKRYQGRDICYGYNEDTLTIYDVTDKANVTNIISRISYEGAAYTHQGWVLDPENQEYLVLDDELDEQRRVGPAAPGYPVTYIWDIRDLENPKNTGIYRSKVKAIDHNQASQHGVLYSLIQLCQELLLLLYPRGITPGGSRSS